MSFNIEVRKKQLESLDQLISLSRDRLTNVFQNLGWSADKIQKKKDDMVKCPLDKNHKILKRNAEKHLEKCILKGEGYSLNEEFLSEPPPDSKYTIALSNEQKIGILSKAYQEVPNFRQAWNGLDRDPRTSNRLISTFSSDERLAIYDYCSENTVGPIPPPEFTTVIEKKHEDRPLTEKEILAQERDAKRRRAKYKSVHVNRKNHTEVMREVIENQMEEYKEWLKAKQQPPIDQKPQKDCNNTPRNGTIEKDEPERANSSISHNSTYSESSRSTSRRDRERKTSHHRSPSYERRREYHYKSPRSPSPRYNKYKSPRYHCKSPPRYHRHYRRTRSRSRSRSRQRYKSSSGSERSYHRYRH